MKRYLAPALFAAAMLLPVAASADIVSEIHITSDGLFAAKNLLVIQKTGMNIFARATWGQPFIRVTILLGANTLISKSHGESATAADLKEGDRLDVEGTIASGADSLIISAVRIRDSALEQASKTIAGTVKSINASELSFILPNKQFGETRVSLSASVPIKKGVRTIQFSDIAVGDKVLSTSGTYDYSTNTLTASSIEVFQNKAVFTPRNFEGVLKSISLAGQALAGQAGTTLPITATVTVSGTDYTVYLDSRATVLSNNKKPASLTRFVVGDSVRLYGAVRQTNLTEIDADTIRDLNF